MLSAARTYGLSSLVRHIGGDGISKDAILVSDFFTFPSLTHSTFFPKIDSFVLCESGDGEGKSDAEDMRSRRKTWDNSLFALDVSPCQKPDELWCCEQVIPVSLSLLCLPGIGLPAR